MQNTTIRSSMDGSISVESGINVADVPNRIILRHFLYKIPQETRNETGQVVFTGSTIVGRLVGVMQPRQPELHE